MCGCGYTCACNMSSFKKREKVLKRTHRERGQLHSRRSLGILEKHKDYVIRAKSYQKKKTALKSLHEKARNRNPDEFYYKMVNTSLKEGKHIVEQDEEEYTNDQLTLMKTRDLKYIQMKVTSERRKVERLTGSLHLTEQAGKKNTHTFFIDSDNEEDVDSIKLFQMTRRDSKGGGLLPLGDSKGAGGGGLPPLASGNGYRELNQRLNRFNELNRMNQKMDTKKKLLTKERRVRIPGSQGIPVTYKWFTERRK